MSHSQTTISQPRYSDEWDHHYGPHRSHSQLRLKSRRHVFPNGWLDAMYAAATLLLVSASLVVLAWASHAWGVHP